MQLGRLIAASAFFSAFLCAQTPAVRSVEINLPNLNANGHAYLRLNGSLHAFHVSDQGVATEMAGFRLDKLLMTAGWGSIPDDQRSQYVVQIDGDGVGAVSLLLSEVVRRALDNRTWLVTERDGKPLSGSEAPWLIVVGPSDVVTPKIRCVRRIRVYGGVERQLAEDREFGRLSNYGTGDGTRMQWERYARVNGVPVLIVTWRSEERHGKNAILLSDRISGWTDRRLLDFLSGPVGLGVDPSATIQRGTEFTVVGFMVVRQPGNTLREYPRPTHQGHLSTNSRLAPRSRTESSAE